MGFLNKLFGGGSSEIELKAPVAGQAVPVSEVSDPTFGEEILGKGMAIIGNRKGDRDLMACYHDGKDYVLEVLDHNVGPANTRVYKKPGNKLGILSTNREIDEIGFYEIESL